MVQSLFVSALIAISARHGRRTDIHIGGCTPNTGVLGGIVVHRALAQPGFSLLVTLVEQSSSDF